MQLLIATGNKGKRREFQQLIGDSLPADAQVTLVLPVDIGLDTMDVVEDGDTLEANALLKARAYAQASGLYALADDSGLYVDALDGRPGIYAARYGGPELDEGGRRRKLLGELQDVPADQRTARFECVIALTNPTTMESVTVHGICPGKIADSERGNNGFGYDPIFIPDVENGEALTFGEIADQDEVRKNTLSHRGDAGRKILPVLIRLARGLNEG
ncbi:MAG TPA: RdgB/HAM1 family non-canonical purine NTP pyrophosphatase [Phototrophicaceae bacterium]|nr:RdgB/HAM1 family non-canonical purine NTP pyrophosphatase [Phototrophicaceae bacterium]